MSRVCPKCGYPNPDNLTECFKCHEDISAEVIREARAMERIRSRQAQSQQRENAQRQRNEDMERRATVQEELNVERENQEVLLRRRYLAGNILQRLWADDLSNNPNWTLRQLKLFLRLYDIVSCVMAGIVIVVVLVCSVGWIISEKHMREGQHSLPPLPTSPSFDYQPPQQNNMGNDMPYGNNMGGYDNGY